MPIILLVGPAGVGKDTVGVALTKVAGFKRIAQADPIKRIARDVFGFTDEQLWGPSSARNAIDSSWVQTDKMKLVTGDVAMSAIAGAIYGLANRGRSLDAVDLNPALLDSVVKFQETLKDFIEKNGGLNARIVLQLLGTEVGRAFDKLIWTRATLNEARRQLDAGAPGVVITDGRFLSEVLEAKRVGAQVWKIVGSSTLTGATHASETELAGIPDHMFDVILSNNKEYGIAALEDAVQSLFKVHFGPHQAFTFDPSDD